jgi:hypothetical protein
LAILSIICWRAIKAVFLRFTSCAGEIAICLQELPIFSPRIIEMASTVRDPARVMAFRLISLYRHALGEIARFIDVASECDSEMIRQELEWDDGENRHYVIGRFRQQDDLVRDSF